MATINGTEDDDNISSGFLPLNDTLISSTYGGNDLVNVFSPAYRVNLGDGDDRVIVGGSGGSAYGGNGDDRLTAFMWIDTHNHYGGNGNDSLFSSASDITSSYNGYGGAGLDIFYLNNDLLSSRNLDGGAGYDLAFYNSDIDKVMALGGTGGPAGASNIAFGSIEAAISGAGNDSLYGGSGNNLLVGGHGNDILFGQGGDDFLVGEARDIAFATAFMGININFNPADAFDPLNASIGGNYASESGGTNDTLYGGSGNDVLSGGDGADVLDGGSGRDWVTYLSSPEGLGVVFNLAGGGTAGHAAGDTYVSIENAQGSNSHDTLTGTDAGNELRGMNGADLLTGREGNDTLNGAQGQDTLHGGKDSDLLTGGDSEDVFVFAGAGTLQSIDTITDFEVNFDEIQLSAAIFRKMGPLGALNAERFALGSATEADDRIIYDPTTGALFYDADGKKAGLAVQFALLDTDLALTADDFVIIG
jgi:Ca2+-binding RTX toxin-like protein